ncbi:MAG: FRG domain-containing protein, partial [Gammaproteobacteria bacterium]|nr:FRG domain-containing protein [Gammaproteobacteria bacterium]
MEEKYFEKIPSWHASSPRFVVMADPISGRIPVTKLNDWREFADLLEDGFFNKPGVQYIFRGHRRHDWSLLPTLGRVTENGIVSDELATSQMALFRRAVRGRLTD